MSARTSPVSSADGEGMRISKGSSAHALALAMPRPLTCGVIAGARAGRAGVLDDGNVFFMVFDGIFGEKPYDGRLLLCGVDAALLRKSVARGVLGSAVMTWLRLLGGRFTDC